MTALAAGHIDDALVSPRECDSNPKRAILWDALGDLADLPMDYARYGYAFPASYIKTQRETLRRLLMTYLEAIYVFRTRPIKFMPLSKRKNIKDPVVQKNVYERALESVREFPLPEPNGIQSLLDSLPHPNARNINRRA